MADLREAVKELRGAIDALAANADLAQDKILKTNLRDARASAALRVQQLSTSTTSSMVRSHAAHITIVITNIITFFTCRGGYRSTQTHAIAGISGVPLSAAFSRLMSLLCCEVWGSLLCESAPGQGGMRRMCRQGPLDQHAQTCAPIWAYQMVSCGSFLSSCSAFETHPGMNVASFTPCAMNLWQLTWSGD